MPSLEVVTVGSAVIDHSYTLSNLPKPDGGAFVRDHTTAVGGVAANVASGLAQLGCETGIITRLGADDAGEIEADLRERGLDLSRVRSGPEESSYTLILRGPGGERMVVAGGQSVPNLRLDDVDMEHLSDASVVFTSAYAPDAVVADLVAARERDEISTLAFDLAGPLSELEGRGTTPATIDRLLSVADLFVVGEVAAQSYFGGHEEAIDTLTQRAVRRAAVTCGDGGAVLLDGDTTIEVPAFEVAIEDTTGAGDAFTAGLIHAWVLDGASAATEAGRFAAAAAALNCTAEGARGRLPPEPDVRAFLDGR